MLLALFAVTGSPGRELLFASMGELGCAGHGLESSKCGAGNGDWSCESLPEPNAPLCHKCTDPWDGHVVSIRCPATWVVTGPPECCKIGHLYMLDEVQELVTQGYNSSVNGYAYGIKFTEVGGPFDGQPGCLINRAVLNDDVRRWPSAPRPHTPPQPPQTHPTPAEGLGPLCPPRVSTHGVCSDTITVCRYPAQILFPNNPNMPPWFPLLGWGGIGDMIFQNYVGLWASWSNDSFVTCNWEVDREDCLANSHFGFIKPLVGDGAEWEEWAERLDRLAGASAVSSNVQDCTDDDPLDWGSITEATYSMARNPETGCTESGQFIIQDFAGEQPAECEGIDPWAKSADVEMSDAQDLLAKFHADKSS